MYKILISLVVVFSWKLWSCNYDFDVSGVVFSWEYPENIQTSQIKIRKKECISANCEDVLCHLVYIDFSKGQSPTYDRYMSHLSQKIEYNLYKKKNTKQPLMYKEDGSIGNYFLVSVNHGKELEFFGKLPSPLHHPDVRPGIYVDQVLVRLTPFFYLNQHFYQTINVTVQIPAIIEIALVDVGGAFDPNDNFQIVDFGDLESNEIQSFDFKIRSNTQSKVFLSSNNNGYMKHDRGNDLIHYAVKFDGQTYDLRGSMGSPVEVSRVFPPSVSAITSRVDIQVGNVENRSSGHYSDFIIITAQAN